VLFRSVQRAEGGRVEACLLPVEAARRDVATDEARGLLLGERLGAGIARRTELADGAQGPCP
jgi:hypothetical protein